MNRRMMLSTTGFLLALSLAPAVGEVRIPDGYELIRLTEDPDLDNAPFINNCGQVVFSKRINDSFDDEEIFLWDDGNVVQVTYNTVRDTLPRINDCGVLVWAQAAAVGQHSNLEIILLNQDGAATLTDNQLTDTHPFINNEGLVAWTQFSGASGSAAKICLFDGVDIHDITDDSRSNQGPMVNQDGQMVWTAYDFDSSPWVGTIMFYSQPDTLPLTDGADADQAPDINDHAQIAWNDNTTGISLWEDGFTYIVTDDGIRPRINNRADIVFTRWDAAEQATHVWLWKDEQFYRLTDGPGNDLRAEINNHGEIVWRRDIGANEDIFLLRPRVGDANADGVIDISDFALFMDMMSGPKEIDPECLGSQTDKDQDGDVDLMDYVVLQRTLVELDELLQLTACLTGPFAPSERCACRFVDFDSDKDVDLRDFAALQIRFDSE